MSILCPLLSCQFHRLILDDELSRAGSGGIIAAVWTPIGIALPPILHHGSREMKERVARPVIAGEKLICLAITEPSVGSDVAGVQTTAVREGDHFVVNGQKKFITGGGCRECFVQQRLLLSVLFSLQMPTIS